jgi:hypothetical protein
LGRQPHWMGAANPGCSLPVGVAVGGWASRLDADWATAVRRVAIALAGVADLSATSRGPVTFGRRAAAIRAGHVASASLALAFWLRAGGCQ